MTKATLRWFWRGGIAAAIGLTVNAISVAWLTEGPLEDLGHGMWSKVNSVLAWSDATTLVFWVICGAPIFALTFGVYGLLTWRFAPGEPIVELHCRRCHHILRGLSEPRCPECGEAI